MAYVLMAEQLRLRDIHVELDLPGEPVSVRGNRLQLEQVLVNLLTNARDALADMPDKRICMQLVGDGDGARIVVADSGAGIPSDLVAKIFDPFFTTKPVGLGTGLGLSISYSIIKEHGGTISVETGPRAGSRFLIRLPAA